MWIASKIGFFSIVLKPDIQIRARVRGDLTRLLNATGLENEIIHTDTSDYPFRIKVTKAGLQTVMLALADSVDYENFKGEIADRPDQREKLHAYHGLWDALLSACGGGLYDQQRRHRVRGERQIERPTSED